MGSRGVDGGRTAGEGATRKKLIGAKFHDIAVGCPRIRHILMQPSRGFINEFSGHVSFAACVERDGAIVCVQIGFAVS
jgi:hypothetical protein